VAIPHSPTDAQASARTRKVPQYVVWAVFLAFNEHQFVQLMPSFAENRTRKFIDQRLLATIRCSPPVTLTIQYSYVKTLSNVMPKGFESNDVRSLGFHALYFRNAPFNARCHLLTVWHNSIHHHMQAPQKKVRRFSCRSFVSAEIQELWSMYRAQQQ
jgi:hypothetical protein